MPTPSVTTALSQYQFSTSFTRRSQFFHAPIKRLQKPVDTRRHPRQVCTQFRVTPPSCLSSHLSGSSMRLHPLTSCPWSSHSRLSPQPWRTNNVTGQPDSVEEQLARLDEQVRSELRAAKKAADAAASGSIGVSQQQASAHQQAGQQGRNAQRANFNVVFLLLLLNCLAFVADHALKVCAWGLADGAGFV